MIRILDSEVINQIAAGEVVERPASVLKELLENSVDAGATDIKVYISEFGTKKIQIIDNGTGIEEADIKNVFLKHATSKITKINDLDEIHTFGFRGEALASISSVSKVILQTKHNSDNIGTEVMYQNGNIVTEKPSSISKGTDIQILDLFENIPARKKFLKSKSTENKILLDIFNKFALANPNISFSLNIDGSQKHYPSNDLQNRVAKVLKIPADELISIYYDGQIAVSGFVIHPKIFMKSKSSQFIFVNKRTVSDSTIYKAVIDGFDTFLMKNQYPGYVVFVDMPSNLVDVNVHPRKTEVRFHNPGDIYRAVRLAVNAGLIRALRQEVHTKLAVQANEQPVVAEHEVIAEPKVDYISQSIESAKTVNELDEFEAFLYKDTVKPEPESVFNEHVLNERITQSALDFNKEITSDISSDPIKENTLFLNFSNATQLLNSYILTDNGKDILVIDQHAASERYFYEKYLNQLKSKNVLSKLLLFPEIITLEDYESNILDENKDIFTDLGFDFELFGSNEIRLTAVPEFVKLDNFGKIFHKMINDILENKEISNVKDKIFHEIAAILACHTAVRFGDILTKDEIIKILKDLVTCEDPYNCPHGRPVMQEFSKYEVEKKFRRCGL